MWRQEPCRRPCKSLCGLQVGGSGANCVDSDRSNLTGFGDPSDMGGEGQG